MRKKYIIDKEDLPKLIKGEILTLTNGNAFSVEVNGTLTNGDMIKAILDPYYISESEHMVYVYLTENDYWNFEYIMTCNEGWWDMPYKAKSDEVEE